jgi:hypothetical protein
MVGDGASEWRWLDGNQICPVFGEKYPDLRWYEKRRERKKILAETTRKKREAT